MVSFFKHKQGSLGLLQALEAQKKGSSKEDGQCGQGFKNLLCRYDWRTCQLEDGAVGLRNRAAFCWLNSVLLGKATAFSDKHTLAAAELVSRLRQALRRLSQHRARSWDERVAFFQWVMRGTISYVSLVGLPSPLELHHLDAAFQNLVLSGMGVRSTVERMSLLAAKRNGGMQIPSVVESLLAATSADLIVLLSGSTTASVLARDALREAMFSPPAQADSLGAWSSIFVDHQPTNQPTNQFPAGEHLTTMAMENPRLSWQISLNIIKRWWMFHPAILVDPRVYVQFGICICSLDSDVPNNSHLLKLFSMFGPGSLPGSLTLLTCWEWCSIPTYSFFNFCWQCVR